MRKEVEADVGGQGSSELLEDLGGQKFRASSTLSLSPRTLVKDGVSLDLLPI